MIHQSSNRTSFLQLIHRCFHNGGRGRNEGASSYSDGLQFSIKIATNNSDRIRRKKREDSNAIQKNQSQLSQDFDSRRFRRERFLQYLLLCGPQSHFQRRQPDHLLNNEWVPSRLRLILLRPNYVFYHYAAMQSFSKSICRRKHSMTLWSYDICL